MSLQVYLNQILELIIKPWILKGHDFALEEDRDNGHDKAKNNNIVQKWKIKNRLEYFFHCFSSPDLSPIENCWQLSKQQLKKYLH